MKILLAMDVSGASQTALSEVVSRPWPSGSAVEVVSVIEPSPLWTTSEAALEAAQCARDVVRRGVAEVQTAGLKAEGATLFGDPRLQILDRARASGADFIFLGSHGRGAASRFLLGNTASTLLRHAGCATVVARGNAEAGPRKLLLATDGSGPSGAAVRSVADRPWPKGSSVHILSAVQPVLPAVHAMFDLPFVESRAVEEARERAMERALDAIRQARKALETTGLEITDSVSVLFEMPRDIILGEASERGTDLIVLGSHGRHGTERFLLGSVAETVAMHATCTVEVIRTGD